MRALRLVLASLAIAALGRAQTTGVPGINDYTINSPTCSGSPSCQTCCFATPVTLSCNVSTAPGNVAVIVWSFCPCSAGFMCGGTNACVPAIPTTACGNTTNTSYDLILGCVSSTFVVVANGSGNATLSLPIPSIGPAPPCSVTLSSQAVVIDPCGLGVALFPGPFVTTQAYSVNFW